ncbi:MAG: Blue-light-activated protein, partial [Myxococcaceae bacterium]|nr:Blue-light-activated protein [Myxococcaceae bacterium]
MRVDPGVPSTEEIVSRVSVLGRFGFFCVRVLDDGTLERVWGSAAGAPQLEDWLARVHPEDHPAAQAALERLVAGSDHETLEVRLTIDDDLLWVQARMYRMQNAAGATVFLCGAMVDITAFKLAEERANATSHQFRALFDDNPVPVATWRVRGEKIYLENYNDAAATFSEGKLAPFLGRELDEVYPVGSPQIEPIRRCARDGVKFTQPMHAVLVATGETKDVITTFVPIPPDVVMVHVEDVTEREASRVALVASEARFRALVLHAPDGVSLFDAQGSFLYQSPRSVTFFGPGAPQNAFELVHPDDLALAHVALARILAAPPGEVEQLELRMRRADGVWRWISLKATNHLSNPAIAGIVVNFQDISDSRELEQKLAQSQKMEAMGQLAGGVAHDFNNLLAVILNFTTFVLDELPKDDPKRVDLLEVVHATERGVRLTRQLLAFARKEAHRPRVLDLVANLRTMQQLLHRTLGEHITTVFALPGEPMNVEIDETRFEQVVLNLALNARDAMPKGGHLHIELTGEVRDGKDHVVLTVSDDGAGIADDVKARIFEPFFTTKDIGLGTGLGLATVYAVVEKAKGTIRVDSSVGKGTTFHVSFPRARAVEEPLAEPSAPSRARTNDAAERVVLVVEDDDALLRTIVRVLEREGFIVRSASSASEAIAMMRDHGDS